MYETYKESCISQFFARKENKPFRFNIGKKSKKQYHGAKRSYIKSLLNMGVIDLRSNEINTRPNCIESSFRKSSVYASFERATIVHVTKTKNKSYSYIKTLSEKDIQIINDNALQFENYGNLYFSPHDICMKLMKNNFFIKYYTKANYDDIVAFQKLKTKCIQYSWTIDGPFFNTFDDFFEKVLTLPQYSYWSMIISGDLCTAELAYFSKNACQKHKFIISEISFERIDSSKKDSTFCETIYREKYGHYMIPSYYYISNTQIKTKLYYDDIYKIYKIIKKNMEEVSYDDNNDFKSSLVSGKVVGKNALYDDDDVENYEICEILNKIT